jgi:hypothetical protein
LIGSPLSHKLLLCFRQSYGVFPLSQWEINGNGNGNVLLVTKNYNRFRGDVGAWTCPIIT